ncbi:3'-5' exonuclease family protein [Chitinimonas sp. BJB300]|uniref:3'-5' exonuclease family protein n=1 Tax=Chitinimonas sp. BJB300 TaxID=1559339 RepID=UPI000C108E9B|nr:exonuclease domain-containing protein [Chitinimonas sp. BJB300]PHV11693.1 ethanolamine utilization protein [Chitinimonas sp. BJB300]TSJ88592.1 ethanolamine utilization protein [Chitinimonas sp. BJB300]
MPSLLDQPFIFVDLETTGANAQRDRITEVGVVEWQGEYAYEWSTLVNPGTPIPPFITTLTGIDDAMVADAPSFASVAADLLERLQGRVFVAHNARFDYGFLKNEFKRAGLDFRARTVCTVKLSKKLFPGEYKHNLDAVAERNGLRAEGERHRALTDARLIYQFLVKIKSERGIEALDAALEAVSRQANLPTGIDPELIETMPDGHGVYMFYDEHAQPLYVGRSHTLKKRVLAHFAADLRANKEIRLSQQVRRIEWISTAGELGAQLAEVRLIKSLAPTHNHVLQQADTLCSWRYKPNEDGSAQPALVFASAVDFGQEPHLYGLYGSQREANNTLKKMADANKLCLWALGLEKAGKRAGAPCFGMQAGHCRGACVGKEPMRTHQARLSAILAKARLQPWPFAGRIAIREQDPASIASDWHLFDHWVYLGTASSEVDFADLLAALPPAHFDVDIYRILSRFLIGKHNLHIVPLPTVATNTGEEDR